MEYPFKIKFVIFNENDKVLKKEEKIRQSLIYNDLKEILKVVFANDINYKYLDRVEAAVSSMDENKQLRLFFDTGHEILKKYQHSLHFHQDHNNCKNNFTIEELKYISNKIKIGLEQFLHYEIDNPIIYMEIDDF
jgi:hypothetical protein